MCLTGIYLMDEEPAVSVREAGPVDLEGEYQEYIARFTHGTLEWVRPLAPKAVDS